jgi:hypothetical protein
MHVLTLLKAGMFDIEIEGQPASIADVDVFYTSN